MPTKTTFLKQLAGWLDIPDDVYEEAVAKYTDLGEFLDKRDGSLNRTEPSIYAQGSIRIGTTIKPYTNDADYDVDLVYCRDLFRTSISHSDLRAQTKANLEAYIRHLKSEGEDVPELVEKNRCLTLNYKNKFHMDILPSVSEKQPSEKGVWITDRQRREWQPSNPAGFAAWFKSRMGTSLEEERKSLAATLEAKVEDIEEWRVKTTLQRVVQLFKRHRDIFFAGKTEFQASSIVITTLAAKCYNNERDLAEAWARLPERMSGQLYRKSTSWILQNPAHPSENFLDRWNQNPKYAQEFFRWLDQLIQDVQKGTVHLDEQSATEHFSPLFGASAVSKCLSNLGSNTLMAQGATNLVPPLAHTHHVKPLPWPKQQQFKVTVASQVESKGGQRLFPLRDNTAVPKRMQLRFSATTNAPLPYVIHWQVVNTGAEAAEARCLRGDFYEGDYRHGAVRIESTGYAGTHWVQAFVVKDGKVVGVSDKVMVRVKGR